MYKPDQRLQIIIGPNGCGKSSLLGELTPFPTNRTDYTENGYKKLIIIHENKEYQLITTYGKTIKYSFVVDGEEQNQNNNKTTQILLAESAFGITSKEWEIITGQTVFTNMSISARKHWFTKISGKDHTYGLEVHKRVSEALRDAQGALKHIRNRQAQETQKMLPEDVSEEIREMLDKVKEYINTILNNRLNEKIDVSAHDKEETNIRSELLKAIKEFNKLNISKELLSKEKLKVLLEDINKRVYIINGELQSIQRLLYSKRRTLTKLEKSQFKTTEELQSHINKLENELSITSPLQELGLTGIDVGKLIDFLNSHSERLKDITEELIETNEVARLRYGSEELSSKIQSLEKEVTRLKLRSASYIGLEENQNTIAIKCPECNYKWNGKITDYISSNIELEDKIHKLEDEVEVLQEQLLLLRNREKALDALGFIERSVSGKESLEKLGGRRVLIESPHSFLNRLHGILHHKVDIEVWVKKQKEYIELKESLNEVKVNTTLLELSSEITELENREKELLEEKIEKDKSKEKYTNMLKIIDRVIIITKNIQKLHKKYESIRKEKIKYSFKNTIDKVLHDLRKTEQTLEMKLQEDLQARTILEKTETEVREIELKTNMLKNLITVLSPTEGIIGRSIMISMESVLMDLNQIISTIWRYNLKVLPCSKGEDVDLTYRFPVDLEGHVSKDVSNTSSSMQEIINLAFRIVVGSRLGLRQYPLFLDEFGRSFDSSHRDVAYEMIYKELSTAEEFSQVFLVSHYLDDFGYYKEADVVSLATDISKEISNDILVVS